MQFFIMLKITQVNRRHKTAPQWAQAAVHEYTDDFGNVFLVSQEATISEIVLDDNISDGVEHKLNVVRVCCNSELCVDVLRVSAPIQTLKLLFNVGTCLLICAATCKQKVKLLTVHIYLLKQHSTWITQHTQVASYEHDKHDLRHKTADANQHQPMVIQITF